MSQLGILEDVTRILSEQRDYMRIFETLGDYELTEENLPAIEDIIYLLKEQERFYRDIRKSLALKTRSYNVKRLMWYLESEKRVWAGIP